MAVPAAAASEIERTVTESLLLGFVRLCRQLDRKVGEADLKAAAAVLGRPGPGDEAAWLGALAARLGHNLDVRRLSGWSLTATAPPFLVLGREGALLVRARTGEHYVVVEPGQGTTSVRSPRALKALGGQILRLKPEAPPARPRAPRQAATKPVAKPRADGRRLQLPGLGRLQVRLKGVLWQVALASVVINLLALATPLFMMTVYNKVINHAALQTLDVLAIGMVTLVGFELVLRALRGYVTAHAGARLEAEIGQDVVRHLLHLPYASFQTVSSTAVLERVRQLDPLRGFLTGHLPLTLVDLAFVGLFLAALFVLTPTMALITAAAMPPFALLSWWAQRRQGRLQSVHHQAATAKLGSLAESVGQALTVKALALEADMEGRYRRHLVRSAWAGLEVGRVAHVVASGGQALQHLTALLLVYVGARMIVSGELTVGALVAASILSSRALAPLRQIALAWTQLRQARQAMGRLDELMAERREQEAGDLASRPELVGRMRLEGVTFRYPGAKAAALENVSLELAPGAITGIAGPPGSGKSTLLKLLIGLETPEVGQVTLDGVDLRSLPPARYRPRLGVVPQEVQLFSGTIAENVGLGADDRAMPRIVAAARFVGADDFIRRLPEGYETVLGERGSGLSLGQRQLLALARAFLRNPRVLILDEATSALDPTSEAQLLANIRRSAKGRTVVLVTHRPAVLQACDRIVLLEHGRIARVGTPGEVLPVRRPAHPESGVS